MPSTPAVPVIPETAHAASRLIIALRVVCGGSVSVSRSLQMLHPDELEANGTGQAQLTPLSAVDAGRPTVLFGEQIDELRHLLELLESPLPGALQVATRRLVFASHRTDAADRLIDLIISAEALFIHYLGNGARFHSDAIAGGAEALGSDAGIGATPAGVHHFMKAAYRRRNEEFHGTRSRRTP
ncbi:hypothetical protein ACQPXM_25165 [Kribbella sp. CA-253562]|uniref:hypothetical protein n=1 Tax=Kribbella sp. CA-253562 TaxID=3239942 RepID=UPI003D94944F